MDFDEKAVAEYHERRKKYISYGLDQYKNAEFLMSLAEPLDGSILEVGTGRGLVTSYIACKTAVTTVDIDREIQSFAKELTRSEGVFDKVAFLIRDILQEPFLDNSFDIVISANAVHHFEEPEKIITAMCRTASRRVIIADFNRAGFEILDKIHKEEGDTHSHGRFPIDKIGELMKVAGLKIDRYEKLQTIVYCGEK